MVEAQSTDLVFSRIPAEDSIERLYRQTITSPLLSEVIAVAYTDEESIVTLTDDRYGNLLPEIQTTYWSGVPLDTHLRSSFRKSCGLDFKGEEDNFQLTDYSATDHIFPTTSKEVAYNPIFKRLFLCHGIVEKKRVPNKIKGYKNVSVKPIEQVLTEIRADLSSRRLMNPLTTGTQRRRQALMLTKQAILLAESERAK